MTPDVEILADVPLFALLDVEERRTLAELFNTVQVAKGDEIFSYGDLGDSLYVVRKGLVRIFMEDDRGQRIVLAENGPGDLFGEISLLDGGPRTASAEAGENTVLLMLNRDDLLEFITKRPPAALGLLTVMGHRLRSTNELLRSNASKNANQEESVHLTLGQRTSGRVASFLGSWFFVAAFVLVTAGWFGWLSTNEPPATLDIRLFVSNLVLTGMVVVQAAFILMSQNRQAAKDRLKADLDYEFSLKEELSLAQLSRDVAFIRGQLQGRDGEPDRTEPARATGRA